MSVMRAVWFTLAGLLVALVSGSASAGLVIDGALVVEPSKTVNFSQFTGNGFQRTAGPVEIGGLVGESLTFTSTTNDSVLGDGFYGLSNNGNWDKGRVGFTGLNNPQGSMTYTFNDGPVSAVGGFLNYPLFPGTVGDDVTIQALAADGVTVLESYNISVLAPILTPGDINSGAFRGIVRARSDIGAFRVLNDSVVLDDLKFARVTAVPEPTGIVMLGSGILVLVGCGWHRRRSV